MHPNETNNYRTMMHEIGHCYGSSELYSIPNDMFHTEIFGLDMMGDSYFATGFMGYHRYRYGWICLTVTMKGSENSKPFLFQARGYLGTRAMRFDHQVWSN